MKNKQNIDIIEKNTYETVKKNLEDDEDIEQVYLLIIYQIINDISDGIKLKELLISIKNNKLNWKHNFYKNIYNDEIDQDNFIIKPFEIEEGVLMCKCGSKRVFSYQKQTRGADEPSSTFAQCSACGHKFVYSG